MLTYLFTVGIITMVLIAGLVDWYKYTKRRFGENER